MVYKSNSVQGNAYLIIRACHLCRMLWCWSFEEALGIDALTLAFATFSTGAFAPCAGGSASVTIAVVVVPVTSAAARRDVVVVVVDLVAYVVIFKFGELVAWGVAKATVSKDTLHVVGPDGKCGSMTQHS